MPRTFLDPELRHWEAFVTGGQPGSRYAARVVFVCQDDPFERPRWLPHESGDVAEAERELAEWDDESLRRHLTDATPLD